jgi:hypothetical protein
MVGWLVVSVRKGSMALKCVNGTVGGGEGQVRSLSGTRQLSNGVVARW